MEKANQYKQVVSCFPPTGQCFELAQSLRDSRASQSELLLGNCVIPHQMVQFLRLGRD